MRTVQETSLDAYQDLINAQALNDRQHEILTMIRELGPMTDRELAECLAEADPNRVRPRRNELVRKGLVEEAGRRRCDVTGRLAIVWQHVHKRIQRELFS